MNFVRFIQDDWHLDIEIIILNIIWFIFHFVRWLGPESHLYPGVLKDLSEMKTQKWDTYFIFQGGNGHHYNCRGKVFFPLSLSMSESRLQVNCEMRWLNIWEIWQWLWENCPKLLSESQHNLQTRPQSFSESEPYHHCKQSTKLWDNNSVYDAFLVSPWLANLKTLENKTTSAEVTFCNRWDKWLRGLSSIIHMSGPVSLPETPGRGY